MLEGLGEGANRARSDRFTMEGGGGYQNLLNRDQCWHIYNQ